MPCMGRRYGDRFFPCRKCGYPIDKEGSREYMGTSNPNLKGETYRYYKCPNCATVIKLKVEKGDA